MTDKIDKLLTGFYDFKKSMEGRMDNLEEKFDKMDDKINDLEARFDGLETRVDNLEDNMNNRFDNIDAKLKEHDDKFDKLFKRLGTTRRMAGENMRDIEHISEKIDNEY